MAAGDDTTPDPLSFKNVPRRPRSAAASWPPRKEEHDCGHPGGISSVPNNASLPAASVASKKRHGGAAAEHVPRAKKHRLLVPIEKPEPKDAKDRVVGIIPPALSHKDKAAAAASSASSSEAEPVVDWAEKERRRKGKTPVVDEDDYAYAAVARRRPAGSGHGNGKLLGDAIRSHGSVAVAGSFKPPPSRTTKPKKPRTKPKKPRKDRNPRKSKKEKPTRDSNARFWCGMGRDRMSSAGSDADYSFDRIGVVSDRLRTTLRGLGVGAAGPMRLYGRLLTRCDRTTQHARLLMSCKRWRAEGAEFPPCAFMTEQEKEAANGDGLPLTAYDRGGDAYELKFRYLESNGACRLITNWTEFLKHNGLLVGPDEPAPVNDEVMLDLWFFRTPGGKIGMVILHYRRGDAPHADAALDEVEQKRLQLMLNNNGAAADAVMEDAVGEANEEDAGVMVEVAPAALAPSSPSEPSGGGGAIAEAAATSSASEPDGANAAEEQAGALGEVADDAPSTTSSELHGGAGRSDVTAPLSLGSVGTEEERAEAGGALMVMVLEVEAATQSAIVVAGPLSSPEQAGGGVAMMATEDEDEAAADLVEAAALSWNVTKYEFQAAQGLLMLSEADTDSDS